MNRNGLVKLIKRGLIEEKLKKVIEESITNNIFNYKKSPVENILDNVFDNGGLELYEDINKYMNVRKMDCALSAAEYVFDMNPETPEEKQALAECMKLGEEYCIHNPFKRKGCGDKNINEVSIKLIEDLMAVYEKCKCACIMLYVAKFQSYFNMEDNLIKKEIHKYKNIAAVWKMYGDIEKHRYMNGEYVLDDENHNNALDSAIDKYNKAIALEKDNCRYINSLADCYKMKKVDGEESLKIAEELYMKSLKIVEKRLNDNRKLSKGKLINLNAVAEVNRRRIEIYENDEENDNTHKIEECIKIINYCYEEIERHENSHEILDSQYYRNKNKACLSIAMFYKKCRDDKNAKKFFEMIIESFDKNIELYSMDGSEIICKGLMNKAVILMYEGRAGEAYENFEMALSYVKTKKVKNGKLRSLLEFNLDKFNVPLVLEEGVIHSIAPNGKAVMIHCRNCNALHFAHIDEFEKDYTVEDFEEMKNKRTRLVFTPLRNFKMPYHDECIRNAFDVLVMDDSIEEEYEIEETNYPKSDAEDMENRELKLVKKGYLGRFDSFIVKKSSGVIENEKDCRVIKVDTKLMTENRKERDILNYKLASYSNCKAFVKFDLYKEEGVMDDKNDGYIAKNIELLF